MSQIFYPLPLDTVTTWPGGYSGHMGTDFGVPVGTEIRATADATIVFSGGDGSSGRMWIEAGKAGFWLQANGESLTIDMLDGNGIIHRFSHLSKLLVSAGQEVRAGDLIALSGNSGFSTGPHLHWELRGNRNWYGGPWYDPRKLNPLPASAMGQAAPIDEDEGDDMLIVVAPDGRWFWMDGDGVVEDIALNFFMPKNSGGWADRAGNVRGAELLASRVVKAKTQGDWELARHQAQSRFAKRQASQTAAVVNALKPLLTATSGLDESKVAALLTEGLKGATVTAKISEADVERIAVASAEETLHLAAAKISK